MIICKKCGHHNTDADQWCANPSCGAYLAFDGAVQEPPAEQKPPADPTATPAAPTTAPTTPSPYQPQPPHASQPVGPSRPAAPAVPPVRPGERVCPACGWGNEQTRTFCRHCGNSLGSAKPAAGVSVTPAPASPVPPVTQPAGPRRRLPIIVGAVLGVAALIFGGYLLGRYIENRTTTAPPAMAPSPSPSPAASPTSSPSPSPTTSGIKLARTDVTAGASTSGEDAGPKYLTDGKTNTYWSASDTDPNPTLTFNLRPPEGVRVVRMVISSGGLPDQYDRRPRPKDICISVDGGECVQRVLADTPAPQEVRVDAPEPVRQVQVTIQSTYDATETGPLARSVAVREAAFYIAP